MKVLLIAENNEELAKVRDMLDEFPEVEDVLETDSAQEAIEMINDDDGEISLVISAYETNEGTGGDVFRHLRRVESNVPFILRSTEDPNDHAVFDGYRIRHLEPQDGYDQFAALFEEITEDGGHAGRIRKAAKKNDEDLDSENEADIA